MFVGTVGLTIGARRQSKKLSSPASFDLLAIELSYVGNYREYNLKFAWHVLHEIIHAITR